MIQNKAIAVVLTMISLVSGCTQTSETQSAGAAAQAKNSGNTFIKSAKPISRGEPAQGDQPAEYTPVFSFVGTQETFRVGASGGAGLILFRQPPTSKDSDPEFLRQVAVCDYMLGEMDRVALPIAQKNASLRPAYWPTCFKEGWEANSIYEIALAENKNNRWPRGNACSVLLGYYDYGAARKFLNRLIRAGGVRKRARGPVLVAWSTPNAKKPLAIDLAGLERDQIANHVSMWLDHFMVPTDEWHDNWVLEKKIAKYKMWAPFILTAVANISAKGMEAIFGVPRAHAQQTETGGPTRFTPQNCKAKG